MRPNIFMWLNFVDARADGSDGNLWGLLLVWSDQGLMAAWLLITAPGTFRELYSNTNCTSADTQISMVYGGWPTTDNQRCLRDDAILCRISSLHTCHGSSDNINGSKLGSRSMVTAEAIFCVKLRKKLASHEWASAGALFHIVVEVTRTDMCHNVIMPGHLCQCVRLWPEWGISWKIPAHGHWRPGDWPLHEISWPGVCRLSWHQCDMWHRTTGASVLRSRQRRGVRAVSLFHFDADTMTVSN